MENKEYIERKELFEEIKSLSVFLGGVNVFNKTAKESVLRVINEQSTADVEEVVRCKECEYGELDDPDFPHQRFCRHHGCDWNDEDHYCGYGKKRKE